MVDPRNFLISSDYPMDMIVGFASGSITIPVGGSISPILIPHGLPFTPLDITTWSLNADMSDSHDTGFFPYGYQPYTIDVRTLGSNIRILGFNNTGSPVTIYWRSSFLEPPDSNADIPPTNSPVDSFQLSSDYNYFKMAYFGNAVNATINHNLGFVPHVLAWANTSTGWTRITIVEDSANAEVSSDENNTYIKTSTADNHTSITYRIYADD